MKINTLLYYSALLTLTFIVYGGSVDTATSRDTYRHALIDGVPIDGESMDEFIRVWTEGIALDELETIRGAIAINDPEVDKYIIRHLYWRVNRYVPNSLFSEPENPLEVFSSDDVVRSFVKRILQREDRKQTPHGIILVAVMLFGQDDEIIEHLGGLGKESDAHAASVLRFIRMANIQHPSFDRLATKSLLSQTMTLVSAAAFYLSSHSDPAADALPLLVNLLLKTDDVLLPESAHERERSIDYFRRNVVSALLNYDQATLASYRVPILSVQYNDEINMGSMSASVYRRLVHVLGE